MSDEQTTEPTLAEVLEAVRALNERIDRLEASL